MVTLLFVLFGGLALGCAISLVAQRNPLYSAVSLIGVFVALAGLYVLLAAPFIAAVQVIVYAGAIMVLVVFVIMLLNVEEEEHRSLNWRFISAAVALGALLFGQAAFFLYFVRTPPVAQLAGSAPEVGLTSSIGTGLFTEYLLPFEITSILILMAIVGAMTLARRASVFQQAAGDVTAGVETLRQSNLRRIDEGRSPVAQGNTEATGGALAERQIERGEAAAPAHASEREGE